MLLFGKKAFPNRIGQQTDLCIFVIYVWWAA